MLLKTAWARNAGQRVTPVINSLPFLRDGRSIKRALFLFYTFLFCRPYSFIVSRWISRARKNDQIRAFRRPDKKDKILYSFESLYCDITAIRSVLI